MSNVKNPNVIPSDFLTKLQDSQMLLSMYLLQREKYITFLNDLMTLNFSPDFTKLAILPFGSGLSTNSLSPPPRPPPPTPTPCP